MELPELGQNCVICNRNDYLPFKCTHCDKIVCVDHKSNHGLDCPLTSAYLGQTNPSTSIDSTKKQSDLKAACNFCRKITLKLELTRCQDCQSDNCLYHRHQVQHNCPKLAELATKRADAQLEIEKMRSDALEKLKSTLNSSNKLPIIEPKQIPVVKIDPKKKALNSRIRVMKIKQFAKGPPNTNPEDRIYFEVKFVHEPEAKLSDSSKDGSIAKIFCTPKHTIGRLVDWSAQELKLTNKNHNQDCDQLKFFVKPTDGGGEFELECNQMFSKYLDSGQLSNGDEIFLTYRAINVSN